MKNKRAAGAAALFSMIIAVLSGCGRHVKSFEPSQNEAVEIYGPPEMLEYQAEHGNLEGYDDVSLNEEEFDPSLNVEECIYGPPEMFEEQKQKSGE